MRNVTFVLLLLAAAGCKTYYMTPGSLKEQLQSIDPAKAREVYDVLRLPVPVPPVPGTNTSAQVSVPLVTGTHMYNGLTEVTCQDNTGATWKVSINYLSQARITEKSGRHKIVYFDTMFLRDSLLYASKSHMIHAAINPPFNINKVTKVELQFRNSRKTKVVP
ncbi:MAG: hypothetical protein JSS79_16060 [Bacteroidetes bacterium]|nr:hypothetical protein [Bacteroidota bacterium]